MHELESLVISISTVEPLYNDGPPKSGQTLYNGLLAWNGMFSIYLPLIKSMGPIMVACHH